MNRRSDQTSFLQLCSVAILILTVGLRARAAAQSCNTFVDLGDRAVSKELRVDGVSFAQIGKSEIWIDEGKPGVLPRRLDMFGELFQLGTAVFVIQGGEINLMDRSGKIAKKFSVNLNVLPHAPIQFYRLVIQAGSVLWFAGMDGIYKISADKLDLEKVVEGRWKFVQIGMAPSFLAIGANSDAYVGSPSSANLWGPIAGGESFERRQTPDTMWFAGSKGVFWIDLRTGLQGQLSDLASRFEPSPDDFFAVRVGNELGLLPVRGSRVLLMTGSPPGAVTQTQGFLWLESDKVLRRALLSAPTNFSVVEGYQGTAVEFWAADGDTRVATKDGKLFLVRSSDPPVAQLSYDFPAKGHFFNLPGIPGFNREEFRGSDRPEYLVYYSGGDLFNFGRDFLVIALSASAAPLPIRMSGPTQTSQDQDVLWLVADSELVVWSAKEPSKINRYKLPKDYSTKVNDRISGKKTSFGLVSRIGDDVYLQDRIDAPPRKSSEAEIEWKEAANNLPASKFIKINGHSIVTDSTPKPPAQWLPSVEVLEGTPERAEPAQAVVLAWRVTDYRCAADAELIRTNVSLKGPDGNLSDVTGKIENLGDNNFRSVFSLPRSVGTYTVHLTLKDVLSREWPYQKDIEVRGK